MSQFNRIKKVLFAFIALALVFGGLEAVLRIIDYQGSPEYSLAKKDIRFAVSGELYGKFDSHRFWRLPNVEPKFSGDNPKIICLADSVTVMYQGQGYPKLLPGALKKIGYEKEVEIFNAGVPEYTSYQGLVYLRRELVKEKPDLVIIQFGWNDHWKSKLGVPDHKVRFPTEGQQFQIHALYNWLTYRLARSLVLSVRFSPRVPLEQYQSNLIKMAEQVERAGGKVIFIAPVFLEKNQEWIKTHREYIASTKNAAKIAGVDYIDLQSSFANGPELFINPESDQVHFNWNGANIIADAIAAKVMESGLLP